MEENKRPMLEDPADVKSGLNPYIAAAVAVLAVILALIVLLALLNGSRTKNAELEAALEEANAQLQLREDVENALSARVTEQDSLIADLQEQLDEFLNIQEAPPVITREQLQAQLHSISELVTKEYIYTNAARDSDNKTWLAGWTMPFSDRSILVMYDGTIKAGIQFNEIEVTVDEPTRTITVKVPPSEITDNIIPQETIDVLEVKDGLFNKVTFEDYNKFISEEKPKMEEKAIERGLLSDADREAKAAIKSLLSLMPGMDTYTLNVE